MFFSSFSNVSFAITCFIFNFLFTCSKPFVFMPLSTTHKNVATHGRVVIVSLSVKPCALDSCYARFYILTCSKPHFNCLQTKSSLQYSSGRATLPKRISNCSQKQSKRLRSLSKYCHAKKLMEKLTFSAELLSLTSVPPVTLFLFIKAGFYNALWSLLYNFALEHPIRRVQVN